MSERRGNSPGAARTAPTWVKILVGLHVLCITIWALPTPPSKVMEGTLNPRGTQWLLFWNARYLKAIQPVQTYLFVTGTWQYWDMFAPDPANCDWYGTAEVEYADGTKKPVVYPRMLDLPIPTKYVKERYRKFYERAHDDAKPIVWPAFAQRMAFMAYDDPKNPPRLVRLIRHWRFVADPGKVQKTQYEHYTYYTHVVDLDWLRKEATRR